jgi:hypothetical protein
VQRALLDSRFGARYVIGPRKLFAGYEHVNVNSVDPVGLRYQFCGLTSG